MVVYNNLHITHEPEKKWIAEREKYQQLSEPKMKWTLNVKSIKQSQKRNGLLKGNGIGRVLNLVAGEESAIQGG